MNIDRHENEEAESINLNSIHSFCFTKKIIRIDVVYTDDASKMNLHTIWYSEIVII